MVTLKLLRLSLAESGLMLPKPTSFQENHYTKFPSPFACGWGHLAVAVKRKRWMVPLGQGGWGQESLLHLLSPSPGLPASPSRSSKTPGNGRVTRCTEPESLNDCVEQSSHHLPWALSVPLRFGGCLSQKLGYSDLIYPLMEPPWFLSQEQPALSHSYSCLFIYYLQLEEYACLYSLDILYFGDTGEL